MAKNTIAQEVATGTSDSYTEHEGSDPTPPATIRRAMLGELKEGDLSLPPSAVGTRSLQFSESAQTSSEKPSQSPPQPAQTTESHSEPKEEEPDSSAPLTDGNGQRMQIQPSGRKSKAQPAKSTRARARSMDGAEEDPEFDEFA